MWKIFPLTITRDGRKVPIREVKWQEQATSDPNVIAQWQQLYGHKIKLWGLPTGPENGILALDVDVKDGGLEAVKKYDVPLTKTQITRSGGIHHLFKYPNDGESYGNKVKFDGSGLDVRGEGGYVAVYNLTDVPMIDAPQWLRDVSRKTKRQEVNVEDAVKVSPEIVNKKLEEACENIREAPEGESNNVLNTEAYKIGQLVVSGSVDYQYAYDMLFKAAKDRGKPDYEAKATIESGFKGGGKNPVVCPFGKDEPILTIPVLDTPVQERWTPPFFNSLDLVNFQKLKKPQIFKNYSTEDIHLTTADGGTGKTTLKLYEAVCLALGEDFLGFENTRREGARTLFITGEDTREKLGAMIGAICKQMGILKDKKKMSKIKNNIVVKKDDDLCLITKDRQGFIHINQESLNKVMEAIVDLKPTLIVFDPISSFWGSESALNDMSKVVAKFMGKLVVASGACVEVINHMGKSSSAGKDMTQFAGRGGTGLPSHSRVSRVLRGISEEEYKEETGFELKENQSAMICNVNKFSDGSPLLNNPFIIVREGFLFSKVALVAREIKEEADKVTDTERVFKYIKSEREQGRYPSKNVIVGKFNTDADKISKDRTSMALEMLMYQGHQGLKIKAVENPDPEVGGKAFIITDMDNREVEYE